jgi:outer membrane murein-binding lipoprotein Lpp
MRPSSRALPGALSGVRPLAAAGLGLALLAGCSSAYYTVMESFGVEKREILKDRVGEGRTDQEEAKEQFSSTLEAFKAASGYEGGDLENLYEKLSGELDRCEVRAADVRDSIDSIQDVATELFNEWKHEEEQYTDPKLREKSQALLQQTRERYTELIAAMHKSEKAMDPVLAAFHDQVLFLKHNLNAAAVSSLYANVAAIESDVVRLVRDMEASIAEADAFIKTLE